MVVNWSILQGHTLFTLSHDSMDRSFITQSVEFPETPLTFSELYRFFTIQKTTRWNGNKRKQIIRNAVWLFPISFFRGGERGSILSSSQLLICPDRSLWRERVLKRRMDRSESKEKTLVFDTFFCSLRTCFAFWIFGEMMGTLHQTCSKPRTRTFLPEPRIDRNGSAVRLYFLESKYCIRRILLGFCSNTARFRFVFTRRADVISWKSHSNYATELSEDIEWWKVPVPMAISLRGKFSVMELIALPYLYKIGNVS